MFRTLTAYLWMSVRDPDHQTKEIPYQAFLYNHYRRNVGTASLCVPHMYTQLQLFPDGMSTHIAVLSGPHERESLVITLPEKTEDKDIQKQRFYRVILLAKWDQATNTELNGVWEKIGIGEISEQDMVPLESLPLSAIEPGDLEWEDVLLQ
jgi:hypothetical protein